MKSSTVVLSCCLVWGLCLAGCMSSRAGLARGQTYQNQDGEEWSNSSRAPIQETSSRTATRTDRRTADASHNTWMDSSTTSRRNTIPLDRTDESSEIESEPSARDRQPWDESALRGEASDEDSILAEDLRETDPIDVESTASDQMDANPFE